MRLRCSGTVHSTFSLSPQRDAGYQRMNETNAVVQHSDGLQTFYKTG